MCGSVDGLCLCVWLCCGWVMAEVAGFLMGFFFFFFPSVVTLFFFFFLIWVFVPVGF